MADQTVLVEGLQDLLKALHESEAAIEPAVRGELRLIGEVVRNDAGWKFDKYDERSAAGYRVVVRQRGVSVEQTLRKTTGERPDFGSLQMRKALLPALDDHTSEVERRVGDVVQRVNNSHF